MISAYKGAAEVEVEILMTRQLFGGSFLVLEGDDDSRFWRAHTSRDDCEIVIAGGKPSVIGGLTRLASRRFSGAVGIIDSDCDRLLGVSLTGPNTIYTDTHDMEGTLLRSRALEKVLAEYGDPAKIKRFEGRDGCSVRDALLMRAFPLGRLRWYSLLVGAALDFKQLHPIRFVDVATWSFDEDALLTAALRQGSLPAKDDLLAQLNSMPSGDLWDICQGHDMVDMLGLGLKRQLGNGNPGRDRIASSLRTGMERSELAATRVYGSLRTWERRNEPFRVLE